MPQIATAWIDTMEALADLADSLTVEEWRRPTDLPGWDVKDNVSHVAGLEAVILGWPHPRTNYRTGSHTSVTISAGSLKDPSICVGA